MAIPPKQMEPASAARVLEEALARGGPPGDLTIADAATKSGLPLRDAERGLHALLSAYRGHLRVTSEGELLFRFPHGFTKPWETRTRIREALEAVGRALLGIGRFVVRAWITVVLLGYVAIFVAVLVALALARSSNNNSRSSSVAGFGLGEVLARVVFDALFWTFHPFSPVSVGYYGGGWGSRAPRPRVKRQGDGTPFYEKVNRFFFGPQPPPADPRATERAILAELRAQKGRLGLADVMRVTGLPRAEADPLMSRLMLDYDGSVEVSEEGGITYAFPDMRKTVAEAAPAPPPPAWATPRRVAPFTGNDTGTNVMIAGLNAFNLVMGWYAVGAHLTVNHLSLLLARVPEQRIHEAGSAIALGYVPLFFSLALFALPLGRALLRPFQERRVAAENGRLGLLRAVLSRLPRGPVAGSALKQAWKEASGTELPERELTRQVVALGGDAEITEEGAVRYRFPDLEAEEHALRAEREAAAEEEARVGKVIFSSDA